MRAIIYKGLETKPSEEIKLKEGKLAPQIKHLGDCIAISGGQKCGKNYCVKKNDIITVRVYAGAPIAIVIAILAIPFVVVGIVKLVNLFQDLKKLSQRKTINRKVESLPYLGGAENQLATGQTQPVIIGEHLFTPYFIDYPLSRISGTDGRDQFTYRVYELGFKEQVIKEIKAGKASLKKFVESKPQEGKFNLDATSSLYDADGFFEITQGGEFVTEEFNKKYYHLESGTVLPKKKDGIQGELNFELPANSKYIEVAILFNGLIGYSDDGSKTSRSVEVKPQYSLDGTTWTTFAFDGATNNVFTRITQEQIRFTARETFSYSEIKNQTDIIKVRLLCPTVASTQQGYDDCYCVYVQAELFNVEESKKQNKFVAEKRLPDKQRGLSTRLGLKIKATEDNQDKLGQINVITQGIAPTPAGNWISKTPTSNPASWLYEILTSETHPLSAISKDEIDLASFTDLFSYCEDEGLEVNAVLLEARPKQQVLEMVLRLCNSVLYRNMTGQLQVATDKLNSQPIALFTSQNVLSTTIDKNLERKTDGVLINYIDSSLGYEQASYLVMHQGKEETPDSVISTVQTEGITSYEQVVKFGRRLLATETLRPKTVKVQTSLEGVFYTPMSKVLLQTETLKTGKGNGEIKKVILDDNDLITHLELYDNFEFTENETNIIVVSLNRFADSFTHTVVNFEIASADGKLIELATPISSSHVNAPKKGDTLAYGVATEPIISEMIIAGVEENANGYTLTLVDYNEAIYDTGDIPEYKPSWASDIGD
ncbi:MAG TPA: phage tail protein, partial [bacterium]|nr:phage tail protein [bacterium]